MDIVKEISINVMEFNILRMTMGENIINVNKNSDISVDDVTNNATSVLCFLIMVKVTRDFTERDLEDSVMGSKDIECQRGIEAFSRP